jgi:membrane protein implicated in regulation of membrane protease activity
MEWYLWVLVGIGLLAAEILTPGGFFVIFFGVAALLVGALVSIGLGGPAALQWLLFSVLSVVSLLLFRRRLVERFSTPPPAKLDEIDTLRGEVAIAGEDLAPGGLGKAELRGTVWTVKNIADQPLRAGQRGRVVGKDGLTLFVRPE